MESRIAQGAKMLYFKRPGPFDPGRLGERLPEGYKKFWNEWRVQKRAPVHYIPEPGRWKRNPRTGEIQPVQNIPLPLKFPRESLEQLWGGEGVIQGYQKRDPKTRRVAHFWVPNIKRNVVYSEILDKYMSVLVTERTISLIHEHYGFDHYILKTPACDLQSHLALRMKRKLLLALFHKDLYVDNPEKQEEVYNKYKDYLSPYSPEEVEWYGLSYEEACKKLVKEEQERKVLQPLKHQYRVELVQELIERGLSPALEGTREPSSSWLSKINPFAGKTQDSSSHQT